MVFGLRSKSERKSDRDFEIKIKKTVKLAQKEKRLKAAKKGIDTRADARKKTLAKSIDRATRSLNKVKAPKRLGKSRIEFDQPKVSLGSPEFRLK